MKEQARKISAEMVRRDEVRDRLKFAAAADMDTLFR